MQAGLPAIAGAIAPAGGPVQAVSLHPVIFVKEARMCITYPFDDAGVHGNLLPNLLVAKSDEKSGKKKPKKKKVVKKATPPPQPVQTRASLFDELGPFGSVHNPATWRWPRTDMF